MSETVQRESFKVDATQLIESFKRLVHEGNVRRIIIRQGDDIIVEFPLTVGVVGALLAPMLAAVGAIAAFLTDCSIDVERTDESNGHDRGSVEAAPGSADAPELEEWMKY